MRGYFTGSYIAITKQPNNSSFLVELVQSSHIGDGISGIIQGVAFVEHNNNQLLVKENSSAKYKFKGSVNERLFVISYNTTVRGEKGAGTLTLQGNSKGSIFEGVWGGYDTDAVLTGRCAWIRSNHRLRHPRDKELILETAQELISNSKKLTESNISATKHEITTGLRNLNVAGFSSLSRSNTSFENIALLTGSNSTGKSSIISSFQILSDLIKDDYKPNEVQPVLIPKDTQSKNTKVISKSISTSKNPRRSQKKIK